MLVQKFYLIIELVYRADKKWQNSAAEKSVIVPHQNIVAKQPYLHCLLNEQNPDIIFGCKTWPSPSI